ncbi:hypothetical protein CKO_01488 [Citrobacter koseri ATCC BAA-895]|uniref:Uncharacterized protein n=1 Tax=Citrobacter koseri (strain ATCC BAA-895 / CDC 4225-83 / SGSC4696) TaxID=290338 RepID=A8AGK8_CITK8|nr:hypothetical protein CKO_01488 [Citrobacter koseri ATCC BAA-895]
MYRPDKAFTPRRRHPAKRQLKLASGDQPRADHQQHRSANRACQRT